MENVESLIKTTVGEIERVLNSKTVVGDPITVEGNTLIPLLSVGFGFGAGGGSGVGMAKQKGDSAGSGTGGGAGVKPVAVIVINKEGVKVEPIAGGIATAIERLGEAAPKTFEKWWELRKEKEEKKKDK